MKELKAKVLFAAWACHNKKWHTYQLWKGPLEKAFEEFLTFDPKEFIEKYGKDKMNLAFLEIIQREKPDYVFLWLMYEEFYPETLIKIKKLSPETKILCYNGDDDYKFYNYTMHFFPLIDYFITTQPEFLDVFRKFGKTPFFGCGCDINKFKPLNLKKDIDVSFVGTPKNDRIDNMREVLRRGIKAKVYGAGWERYPEFRKAHAGEIPEEEFIKVINKSKINICLSKNYFGGTHILERFFEINACKSFCLTEYTPGYDLLFKEGEDMATFKDKKELAEKIEFYLKNEKARIKIMNNAYRKTLKYFSNERHLEKVLRFAEKDKQRQTVNPAETNGKYLYVSYSDLMKGKDVLRNITKDYDYISFKSKKSMPLRHKEYFQIKALERTKLPMCCCDNVLASKLIGEYASLCLYYAYDMKDKRYFNSNLDISQLMVKKNFLIQNIDKFVSLYKGKPANFINKENTNFISIPLVKLSRKTELPLEDIEHRLFYYFERELLVLRNSGRLIKSSYPARLLTYSLLFNRPLAKFLLRYTLKRSKNNLLIAASNILSPIFT